MAVAVPHRHTHPQPESFLLLLFFLKESSFTKDFRGQVASGNDILRSFDAGKGPLSNKIKFSACASPTLP
eukprot:3222810-Rhodomonas_salina.1